MLALASEASVGTGAGFGSGAGFELVQG